MAKHLQSRRCICGHERQCKGMSLAFQMLHDSRGGHVEVPLACADPPAYEFLHRMNELRKAYFRHLGKNEDHPVTSSIADAEADLPNESQFVALHHFHPKVIRRVANASSSPSGRGRSAIRQQVPHTLTPKEIRRMRLEMSAVSSEADRVTTVNGEPTEEFFFVPNYPMEDAHQDLRELSWAERGPNVITRDVYQNAKKEIQAQKKQKQKKKANKKSKTEKAANQVDDLVAFNPTSSQAMEAMLASIPQEKVAKDQSRRREQQSPKKVPRDKQAVEESAELEDSYTALPRSSLMDAFEKSYSVQELLRHSTTNTRRSSKKTSTLPTIGCDTELGASDTTVVNVRRPRSSGNADETLGASDATVVNNGGEMSTSNFHASNESIQVTDGTFHASDLTVRATGATARLLHSSDTTIQASNVPGAPKGYTSISDSRDSIWGSSLSAAQIANDFPLDELPKRQSSTPLPVCEPTKEASPVTAVATSLSSPLSRRRSSTRDSILGELQSGNKVTPIAESKPTLAESTDATADEVAALRTNNFPTTTRKLTGEDSWPSDEVDTAFSNGDSPNEDIDDKAYWVKAHKENLEKNTDQSHRQSLPLGSRSVSPHTARSCRAEGNRAATRSLSPSPGLRRANTESNIMGTRPSLSRQMMNQSLRSIDESGGSSGACRRMALSQPIGELSPIGLKGKPKIKRIDSSKRAMQYFVHESGTTKTESPGRSRSPKRVTSKSSRGRSVSPKSPPSSARVSGEFAEAMNASSPAILGYRFGSSAKTMVRLSSVPDIKASSSAVQPRGSETLTSMFNNRTDSCPSLGVHGRTPLTEAKGSGDIARDDVESAVERANIENGNMLTAASNLDDSLCVDEFYKEATNSQRPLTVETEAQGKPMPSHSAIPAHFNRSYPVTKKAGTGTGTGRAWESLDSDPALTDEHTNAAGFLIDGGRACRPEGCRQALQHTLKQGASYVSLDLDQVFTGSKDPESSQQSRANSKSQGSQLQKSSRSTGIRQGASLDESRCMERETLRALFPFRDLKEKKRDSLTKSPPATMDSSRGDSARCELDDSGRMEPEKLRVVFPFQNIKAKRKESQIKSPHASSDTLDSSGTTPAVHGLGLPQVGSQQSKLVSYSTFASEQLPMEPSRPLKVKELQLTTLPEIVEEESPESIEHKLEASSKRGADLELPPLEPMTRHELPKEHQTSKNKIVLDTPVFTPPLSSDVWNYSASASKSSLSGEDSFAVQTTNSSLQEEFHLSFPPAQALVRRKLPSAADMCLSSPAGSNAPIGYARDLLDDKIDSGLYTRVSLRDLEITSAMPEASRPGKGKAGGEKGKAPGKGKARGERIEAKNSWKKKPRTGPSNEQATREETIRDYMLSLV